MSFANTLNRFKLLSDLDDTDVSKWSPVLRESMEYVRSMIQKDCLTESEQRRVDSAAGVYAYYRYICYTIDNEKSFRAGDMNVTFNGDKLKLAEKMWESELKSLQNITGESPFVFRRML